MIWPVQNGPKKGEQWDIHFEPVKDKDNNPIPLHFVIVISVAPCPGGVFSEEPESYHMIDGTVKRMSFDEWRSKFWSGTHSRETTPTAKSPAATKITKSTTKVWSTSEKHVEFLQLNEIFDRLRENGEWTRFQEELDRVSKANTTINAQLIVAFQRVCAAYMQKKLEQAKKYFHEYEKLIEKSEESRIFEVEALFMKSGMKRFREKYIESYEYLSHAAELIKDIPVSLTTAWVHCMLATVCTILSNKRGNSQYQRERYVREAEEHFTTSLDHAKHLKQIPKAKMDLEEAIYINQTFLQLGSSITGDGCYSDVQLTIEDINSRKSTLSKRLKGEQSEHPCRFIAIQYDLIQSDLHFRLS